MWCASITAARCSPLADYSRAHFSNSSVNGKRGTAASPVVIDASPLLFFSRSFICIFIFVCCLLSRGTLPLMVIAFDGARFASHLAALIAWNHFTLSTWSTRSFKIKSSFWRMLKKKNSYFTRLMHWFFKKFHIFNYFENFEIFFNCTKISQISKFDTFFFISNFYHFIRWFFFLNFWFHLKLFTKISQLTR